MKGDEIQEVSKGADDICLIHHVKSLNVFLV